MTRSFVRALPVFGLAALVAGSAALAVEPKKEAAPEGSAKSSAMEACMNMMQGPGVTEEGKRAMREFMQSDRAPQAMANMMEMARRMGNGDVMLGMTRMMEMMGSMGGGMMGGQHGMQPGQGQSEK